MVVDYDSEEAKLRLFRGPCMVMTPIGHRRISLQAGRVTLWIVLLQRTYVIVSGC